MERGEGRKQLPDLNKSIDETVLWTLSPTDVASNNNTSAVEVAAPAADDRHNHGLTKRGPGRPKSSKNFTNAEGSGSGQLTLVQNPAKKLKGKEIVMIPADGSAVIPITRNKIPEKKQKNGDVDLVNSLLSRFDAIRRHLCQDKGVKAALTVALNTFKGLELRTNLNKRIGYVPGVEVGDIFYQHGEMGLVGLHTVPVSVELIGAKDTGEHKLPLALSVVSSGKNADVSDDPQALIFMGLGGSKQYNSGHECDQTMTNTFNLALDTAKSLKSEVRVVRSCGESPNKIYIYDGLYMIIDKWEEKSPSGFKVYKFKMVREPNQKPAFEKWRRVDEWRYGSAKRPGILFPDIAFGAENQKVPLVNEVDGQRAPDFFKYLTSIVNNAVSPLKPILGACTCILKRSCPYSDGILVRRMSVVYECGKSCLCSLECENKMIHIGLKFKFEVFRTAKCGWGLRSWDPIRSGSFICEYAGERLGDKADEDDEDDYIFDKTRIYKPFAWNYEPTVVCEDPNDEGFDKDDFYQPPSSYPIERSSYFSISAKNSGNIARFLNHSCSPNVFWQTIMSERDGFWCEHIAFFAKKHIPPLTELTYDYGISGVYGKKRCLCGSRKCTGSFG